MRFNNVSILSVAHVDAPVRVTSAELCERLAPTMERHGLRSNLLESASGVIARRYWDGEVSASQAATRAAERAIEEAGIDRNRLGVLINTSVSRDYLEPSVACLVHGNLKLPPTCMNFDVSNACLGFVNGMMLIGNMIERGQVDYGIVVNGESAKLVQDNTIARLLRPDSTIEEFRNQFATLTLGSGAAAMVLCRADLVGGSRRITGAVSRAATEHNHLCRGTNEIMETDAKALLFAGMGLAQETWTVAQEQLGWDASSLDEVVIHQVSSSHTQLFCQTMDVDPEKVLRVFPEFGNIGPAALPIALSKSMEAGRIETGDRVALMGIGSGLNCTMAEVLW